MSEKSTAGLRPDRLAEMLAIEPSQPTQTPEEALADLLACALPERDGTLGAALLGADTSLDVLRAVKDHAKRLGTAADNSAEQAAASAIYYAAIAAALVRHNGARLTHMTDDQIRHGLDALAANDWVPAAIKALFTQATAFAIPPGERGP